MEPCRDSNKACPAVRGFLSQVYLAYLPAAHILEFTVEMGILAYGAAVGYSDPKTISSKGLCSSLPFECSHGLSRAGVITVNGQHSPLALMVQAPCAACRTVR